MTANILADLDEKLNQFKEEILDPNGMKACIVGSMALYKLGLTETYPHDIDLEVITTPKDEAIFNALSCSQNIHFHSKKNSYNGTLCNPEAHMENVTWTHKPYIFKYKGVEINIWAVTGFSHDKFVTLENGIKCAGVMSVLKKKIAYRRVKDITFLTHLSAKLLGMTQKDTK